MIELSNAYSHENTMMVILVNALIAFIAMSHSDPLI